MKSHAKRVLVPVRTLLDDVTPMKIPTLVQGGRYGKISRSPSRTGHELSPLLLGDCSLSKE